MTKILFVFLGGGAGAMGRYLLSAGSFRLLGDRLPWGTIVVNLLGSFLIGFLWAGFERTMLPMNLRAFVFTGFLAGFTTFSTYALESLNLFREGETMKAFLNIGIMNLGGLLFAAAGVLLFMRIFK